MHSLPTEAKASTYSREAPPTRFYLPIQASLPDIPGFDRHQLIPIDVQIAHSTGNG